jgi:hypothetical protein
MAMPWLFPYLPSLARLDFQSSKPTRSLLTHHTSHDKHRTPSPPETRNKDAYHSRWHIEQSLAAICGRTPPVGSSKSLSIWAPLATEAPPRRCANNIYLFQLSLNRRRGVCRLTCQQPVKRGCPRRTDANEALTMVRGSGGSRLEVPSILRHADINPSPPRAPSP